jgi:AcrR family transcriptional regulator
MSGSATSARSRRDEIIATSARLFRRSGYDDTSIRDIATALEIKSASLYHHFESKAEILFAISHGVMEDFGTEVTPALAQATDPVAAIDAVVDAHLRFDAGNRDRVLVSAHERHSLPAPRQRAINAMRARHRQAVRQVIVDGSAAGDFAVDDPVVATAALLDLLTGVKEWYHPPRDGRLDHLVATYQRLAGAVLGRASERNVATAAGRSDPRNSNAQPTR